MGEERFEFEEVFFVVDGFVTTEGDVEEAGFVEAAEAVETGAVEVVKASIICLSNYNNYDGPTTTPRGLRAPEVRLGPTKKYLALFSSPALFSSTPMLVLFKTCSLRSILKVFVLAPQLSNSRPGAHIDSVHQCVYYCDSSGIGVL